MNKMQLKFISKSENEIFARNAVAAFILPVNPTLSELSDVKTAVSEAVTNCIVHAYQKQEGWIEITCTLDKHQLHITVADSGKGIENVAQAIAPFYTTLPDDERSGMGFTIMQTFMTGFSVTSTPHEGTTVEMYKTFGGTETADAR